MSGLILNEDTWLEIVISDARGRWAAPADIEAQPFYPQ